jgi:hypothetical protein
MIPSMAPCVPDNSENTPYVETSAPSTIPSKPDASSGFLSVEPSQLTSIPSSQVYQTTVSKAQSPSDQPTVASSSSPTWPRPEMPSKFPSLVPSNSVSKPDVPSRSSMVGTLESPSTRFPSKSPIQVVSTASSPTNSNASSTSSTRAPATRPNLGFRRQRLPNSLLHWMLLVDLIFVHISLLSADYQHMFQIDQNKEHTTEARSNFHNVIRRSKKDNSKNNDANDESDFLEGPAVIVFTSHPHSIRL